MIKLNEWVENKDFDALWDKYVPASGDADTMFGEAIRAVGRLEYDYYNNGFMNAYEDSPQDNVHDEDDVQKLGPPNEYFADLGVHLSKYLKNKNAPDDVKAAGKFITPGTGGAEPALQKVDPKFGSAVKKLKDWLVANAPGAGETVATESLETHLQNKLYQGLKEDDMIINEEKSMRIECPTGADRASVIKWLIKNGYAITSDKEPATGHVVVAVPYKSFTATAIIGALKKFTNSRLASLKSSVKAETSKPVADVSGSGKGAPTPGKKVELFTSTNKDKLTAIKAPVEVAKSGGPKGDISNGDKPDALKSIWKKDPVGLELKKV